MTYEFASLGNANNELCRLRSSFEPEVVCFAIFVDEAHELPHIDVLFQFWVISTVGKESPALYSDNEAAQRV